MAVQPGGSRPFDGLVQGAGAGLGGGGGDAVGETFVEPERRPDRKLFIGEPVGEFMAEAEGQLEGIATGMQQDFVVALGGQRLGAEEGCGPFVERRRPLQADNQGRWPWRGAEDLQRGAHGDGERGGEDARDRFRRGDDRALDESFAKGERGGILRGCENGKAGHRGERQQEGERKNPAETKRKGTHRITIAQFRTDGRGKSD